MSPPFQILNEVNDDIDFVIAKLKSVVYPGNCTHLFFKRNLRNLLSNHQLHNHCTEKKFTIQSYLFTFHRQEYP